ncbi:hypothetical protein GMAR_ORF250 [Golden Marseillevirus]|uniref:hypothetical protein n=1 Tax=Golden Marseillevirus TaxID=1720526 RepID=UPI000877A917|nr:hypothetical protein GMAR_ORF250 [Golden Marseillevirus]ALX27624.1 hypothetical protein GMAR_ORF250 [Golden Marseillevirus]
MFLALQLQKIGYRWCLDRMEFPNFTKSDSSLPGVYCPACKSRSCKGKGHCSMWDTLLDVQGRPMEPGDWYKQWGPYDTMNPVNSRVKNCMMSYAPCSMVSKVKDYQISQGSYPFSKKMIKSIDERVPRVGKQQQRPRCRCRHQSFPNCSSTHFVPFGTRKKGRSWCESLWLSSTVHLALRSGNGKSSERSSTRHQISYQQHFNQQGSFGPLVDERLPSFWYIAQTKMQDPDREFNCDKCGQEMDHGEEGFDCYDCQRIYSRCEECGTRGIFLFLMVWNDDAKDYTKMEWIGNFGDMDILQNKTKGLDFADCWAHSDTVKLFWHCVACDKHYIKEAD